MKKLLILVACAFAFGMPKNHGMTNDPGLKLAFEKKYKAALANFIERCSNGDGYACGMAGYFYDKGFGDIPKNHKLAIKFYKKGCALNDADSCTLLGYNAYKNKDYKKAKRLLEKGCKLGNKDACNYLNKF